MSASALQKAILALDRATTTSELVKATQTICGLKDLEAAPTLIKVLGFNNPAVGAVATQGLIALGRDVVPILVVNLDVGNYGARAWVVRAIATLRDPRGLDLLEHALNADIAPSVRRSATRGLAEMELEGSNVSKDFSRCCEALFKAAADDEWIVRYAAAFGLEQRFGHNSTNTGLKTQAIAHLEELSSNSEAVKVVKQRAKLALQRLQAG
ncbi:phycocyanobilin lyase beta subunit [Synechococcus sp. CC9902]|uniref:HEAT repeat domain-containing protein n=1 Tax=Synechococcus sp. (strain CC9902) TaxID=316279 RepID=UPI00005D43F6|nr:HEAT repeat domain-containing protein [Synechococcus sp. CC9902]ABB26869.1 phycocyanobilin lyase beta subunit [Synechococcus sp. CC9902]